MPKKLTEIQGFFGLTPPKEESMETASGGPAVNPLPPAEYEYEETPEGFEMEAEQTYPVEGGILEKSEEIEIKKTDRNEPIRRKIISNLNSSGLTMELGGSFDLDLMEGDEDGYQS